MDDIKKSIINLVNDDNYIPPKKFINILSL